MSKMSWKETLLSAQVSGTLFTTFTTAKTVLPVGAIYTLPQNYLQIGTVLRISIAGAISNIVTTPGTIVFQVMFGSVIAFTTGNIQLSTTAHTTLPFWLEILMTCRSIGASTSATMIGQAIMHSQCVAATAVVDSTSSHAMLMAPNTNPAVGTGFDSTASQAVDIFAGFSISNAGNGVRIDQYTISAEN